MVEGHSVHRVAARHRRQLLGRAFRATSPNARFVDGARAIDRRPLRRVEAVGKNLFCFFGQNSDPLPPVVVHVHFGMSGRWATFDLDREQDPEPTPTTRLRLEGLPEEGSPLVSHLSAMTVVHGGHALFAQKRAKLGQDPLRTDADPEALWNRVRKSKKSIGALIMDQSFFAGPGNIYRAEILFKAAVHPEIRGVDLHAEQFRLVWEHSVALLRRGFEGGSILTVDPDEAKRLGKPRMRRYIYNQSRCGRCGANVKSWTLGPTRLVAQCTGRFVHGPSHVLTI